uniref:Fucose-1-phosphate guanylyltransferase n=1 Tax=Nothoprocta perdicaria TaxID=30464 RepID=A0A8C6YV36_NOTPE
MAVPRGASRSVPARAPRASRRSAGPARRLFRPGRAGPGGRRLGAARDMAAAARSAARRRDTARRMARFAALAGGAARPGRFWDVVAVTAADAAQAAAFQRQLEQKLRAGTLPRGARYLALADPPGAKSGNGGSTLHVLQCLENLYGDKWTSFLVLIIHSASSLAKLRPWLARRVSCKAYLSRGVLSGLQPLSITALLVGHT